MGKKSHNQKSYEVFSKNYHRMLKLFWSTPELFYPEIDEIRKKFGIREQMPIDPIKDKENGVQLVETGLEKSNDFLAKNEAELPWVYERLKLVRRKLKLGREWNKTLLVYIVSGVAFPPTCSVFIDVNETDNVIIFEINKETTKADLDLAWKNTEKDRIELFEKARGTFPSPKAIKNLINDIESKSLKFERPFRESDTIKKYKTRDLDIVSELFPSSGDNDEDFEELKKADGRRVNRLRVNKNRLKKI